MSKQELEAQVLHLPRPERARLAQKLIASLDEDDEIEQAWIEEAERRYEALRSGSTDIQTLRETLKEVLVETLQEQRALLHEVFAEVLEDYALAEAIDEGKETALTTRKEVMRLLEGEM